MSTIHTDGHVLHSARIYDTIVGVVTLGRERRFRTDTITLAKLTHDDRVLDVGCGTGTLLLAAAESGAKVTGVDPSPEMIDRARAKARAAGVEAAFEVGVVETLPFDDDSFDVVFCTLVFHHLPASLQPIALAEIRRVLAPSGRIVLVEFAREPLMHRVVGAFMRNHGDHAHAHQGVTALVAALERAGFDTVETTRLTPSFLCAFVARPA